MGRKLLQFLLKVLNFLLSLSGLTMLVYGLYLLLRWMRHQKEAHSVLARRLLLAVDQSSKLGSAWFIYLFIAVGAILLVISCFGCVGSATRSRCCLSFYVSLVIILVLAEVGFGSFIFFNQKWKEVIPTDSTGNFNMIYNFLNSHWNIGLWVAVGVVALEIMALLIALCLRFASQVTYDTSDDEVIFRPGNQRPFATNIVVPGKRTPSPTTETKQIPKKRGQVYVA